MVQDVYEITELVFVWAEQIMRDAQSYAKILQYARDEADRFHEGNKNDPELSDVYEVPSEVSRALIAKAQTLIWASAQLELWYAKLAAIRREVKDEVPGLRDLRNALEHLNEAEFAYGYARKPSSQLGVDASARKAWSLDKLRGKRLAMRTGSLLFDLMDPTVLHSFAISAYEMARKQNSEDANRLLMSASLANVDA